MSAFIKKLTAPSNRFRSRRLLSILVLLTCLLGFSLAITSAQTSPVHFGYGAGIHFVDPDGRNQVPFTSNPSSGTVDFTLYSIPTADFVSHYDSLEPYEAHNIDLSGLIEVASWQEAYEPRGGYYYDLQTTTLPTDTTPSGLYVLAANQESSNGAETLLVWSQNVLTVKYNHRNQVAVWASKLQDGTPVANMTVTLYDTGQNAVEQQTTNIDGIAIFDTASIKPLLVIGEVDGQVTVSGFNDSWRTNSARWSYYDYNQPQAEAYRIYLYTDRPIYRPGHTVHYAAILRHNQDGVYTPVATETTVAATLRDSRNNVVFERALTTDAFGMISANFELGAEPPLGDYEIALTIEGQTQKQKLRVEEYRKPEYQVEVTTPTDHVITGDDIPITVAADYFFGQPVARASVTLKIYRRSYYYYYHWWEWTYDDIQPIPGGTLVDEFQGMTDADGRWIVNYQPHSDADHNTTYTFVASVTDARELPVEGRKVLPVYWNTFKLSTHTDRYGYDFGDPVTVNLSARSHSGAPIADKSIQVRVERDYYDATDEIIAEQDVTTDGAGLAQATFTNLPQGWYRIRSTSTDERGRTVTNNRYLWIFDRNGGSWWYFNNNDLTITTDKDSYAVGDTAQLMIESKLRGMALLTLERESVQKEIIVNLDGPMTMVEVPIEESAAPNIFARIHIFKPREPDDTIDSWYSVSLEGELVAAQTELTVPVVDKRLDVSISTDAEAYLPGGDAVLTIKVTNSNGQPVAARVGLALVDEAIYALQEDLSADLFETFYSRRRGMVNTYDGLAKNHFYWWEFALGGDALAPTESPPVDDTGELSDRTDDLSAPRRLFLDTAYWNPSIETDDTGTATITIPLPDNLTTWRATARAVTLDTRVGDTRAELLVTKEIIARPALPRFSVLGDRFQVGLVGQNFSDGETQGVFEIASDGLMILDGTAQAHPLPIGVSARSDWTAVASDIGTNLVTSKLTTNNGEDSVELPLRTKPFAIPERVTASGVAKPNAVETFEIPLNAINETSDLTIRLSPSIALGVLDGLDDLIDYPYGCVEQTMSRVLPTAVASKAYKDLGIPNPKAEELPDIVAQGLQRLYGFQHEGGGWGWFYDDEDGLYLTSYVLFGLLMVQEAGFTVDVEVLNRGFGYLDLAYDSADQPGIKAYALYVQALAGRGSLADAQALLSQQNRMDASALGTLALALKQLGDEDSAQSVVDRLITQAVEIGGTVHWPAGERDWYHWRTMSSTEKNTAIAVRVLATLRPEASTLSKAVRWLMDHRRGAGWRDTQATAFAVLGLVDYIKVSGTLAADYTYNVYLNGEVVTTGQVTPETVTQPIEPVVIPGDTLQLGANEVRIEQTVSSGSSTTPQAPLYYAMLLRQSLFFPGFEAVSSIDQGLRIQSAYRLVEGTPRTDGAYNIGDLVEVEVTVDVRDEMWYLLVEIPIPAGFEPLNERLNPVSYGDDFFPGFWWHHWGYNRKNAYDDRVEFFVTHAWKGTRRLTFLMRATTPGEFSVLPAQAYPMYAEEIWGRSSSHRVQVAPELLATRPTLAGDFDHDCRVTDFDTQLVAAAWGTTNTQQDITGKNGINDGIVDLRDVVAVAGRRGANCLADRNAPGVGTGQASVELNLSAGEALVGGRFSVNVRLRDLNNVGGFGLTLGFAATKVHATGVEWNSKLADMLPLGPYLNNEIGQITFGAFELPDSISEDEIIATITFEGRSVGEAEINAVAVQAVDSNGQLIDGNILTTSGNVVLVEGEELFLPLVSH